MENLKPIEKNNERVLLTSQIAESYGTDVRTISNNFNRNKERYIDGKHYYCLTGDELKEFKTIHQNDEQFKHASVIYLWTQKGALLHAKSLGTDKAWEVYDHLVDSYFQKNNNSYNIQQSKEDEIILAVVKSNSIQERMLALNEYTQYIKEPLLETISTQSITIEKQSNTIQEQQPKVEYHDKVINRQDLINTSSIAKDLGLTAQELNKILHNKRIIYKRGSTWLPYSNYQWLISDDYADYQIYDDNNMPQVLKWTEKGRKWIIETFFEKVQFGFGRSFKYKLKE